MESRRVTTKPKAEMAVATAIKRFSSVTGENALDDLVRELTAAATNTQRRPLSHVNQAMLGVDGRTLAGFRYSANALRQLCRLLGRGFSQTVFDLGGIALTDEDAGEGPHDPVLAINLLNDVIRLRFEQRLRNYEFIVDTREKRIDGLVGVRYAYLSNAIFADRVRGVLRGAGVKFHEAVLANRRLTVRYRTIQPLFVLPGDVPEPFYGGYHFGNSEVGDCAVRTALLLIRQRADSKAVSEFTGRGRLVHIRGPKFSEKLREQLSAIVERIGELAELCPRFETLREKSLQLSANAEERDKRVTTLLRRLQHWGLHRTLAKRVMSRVQLRGSAIADKTEQPVTGDTVVSRTEWDLFNAMTYMAKRQPPETQERLEQLAYQLLIGRKTIS